MSRPQDRTSNGTSGVWENAYRDKWKWDKVAWDVLGGR
jgi:nitrate reductase alpha subunit